MQKNSEAWEITGSLHIVFVTMAINDNVLYVKECMLPGTQFLELKLACENPNTCLIIHIPTK